MNVYITGGSGFLGRAIVAAAKARGHHVATPRSHECDLRELASVQDFLRQEREAGRPVDVIVMSAAIYGGLNFVCSESATVFQANVRMIANLYEAAAREGVRKVVAVGSSCSYPDRAENLTEDRFWDGPVADSVLGYGFTKRVQLVAQKVHHRQHGLEGNHLIVTNLYGPHDVFTERRGHAISVLIKRYADAAAADAPAVVNWGDGTPIREFLHVADAADAIAEAIAWPHDLHPVNVGTGVGTSIRALTELIAAAVDYRGETQWDTTKPNGVMRKVMSIDRLKNLYPAFTPRSLATGLQETIAWYLANKAEADARE